MVLGVFSNKNCSAGPANQHASDLRAVRAGRANIYYLQLRLAIIITPNFSDYYSRTDFPGDRELRRDNLARVFASFFKKKPFLPLSYRHPGHGV
jgi:hypothetical protein